MEREPTVRWRKVWISWGIYWAAASKVPVRPRKAAQREMRRREEEPNGDGAAVVAGGEGGEGGVGQKLVSHNLGCAVAGEKTQGINIYALLCVTNCHLNGVI